MLFFERKWFSAESIAAVSVYYAFPLVGLGREYTDLPGGDFGAVSGPDIQSERCQHRHYLQIDVDH